MRESRGRGGKFRTFAAFAIGATAGSILALLYAPASGKVTRRRIALKVRNLQRNTARRLGQTRRALVTQAAQVREAATEWIAEHVPYNGKAQLHQRRIRHVAAH